MALPPSRTAAPRHRGQAAPRPREAPKRAGAGAALRHRAMSSPAGHQRCPRGQAARGAAGPPGPGRAPPDLPLLVPPRSPPVSSPSQPPPPRAAPPWKQEQEVSSAPSPVPGPHLCPVGPQGGDPLLGGHQLAGQPRGDASHGYLWQAAGQLRLCSRAGRAGSGPLGGCCLLVTSAPAAFSPSA